ncbi:MAG: AAA family ATPase, partial [Burkholderiales bacterium]|nr:AAA family ATPase [Anaerolineae bacterium]
YTVAKAVVETVIRFAQEQGIPRMPTILLSPLENRMTLAQSFNAAGVYAAGWNGDTWWPLGVDNEGHPINPGSAPVGLLDDVYNRTQQPLWINLNVNGEQERGRKDGHVLVVGAPGTGKTMFLRTLAMSLALLHPPDAVNMYFLSFTGAGLDEVSRLPHAERVIVGIETERTRRLFGRLIKTLNERQLEPAKAFQPVIMLCIDQYEQFREVYRDTHLNDFERLLNEGRAVGIYLVITTSSVSAVPDRIRAVVQQRIVFQLGTASDYTLIVGRIDAPLEHDLPPGRGYLYGSPPLISQISLPSSAETVTSEREALAQMTRTIDAMRQTSPQFPAPINELPSRVLLHSFVQPEISPELLTALGYNDDDGLSLFTLDWWAAGPHFIVTGPPGSGKTNLLQAAILSAAQSRSPQELRFVLVDFAQRSLRPLSALKHVIARVTNVVDLQTQLANLQSELEAFDTRGETETEYTEGALLGKFPATVIVIDDYDATSEALSGHLDTLRQLRDHVRLHSDFGFYVWAAGDLERTADPLIKQLLLRRSGFGLMTRESLQKLNIRITGLPSEIMPEGRAFFPQQNSVQVVQIALVEDTPAYVKRINEQWDGYERAAWLNPVRGVQVRRTVKPTETMGNMGELSIDTEGLIEDLFSQSDEQ